MYHYAAPIEDMQFLLDQVTGFTGVRNLLGYSEVTEDLISAILWQAAKFGANVLAPLNQSGDTEGAVLKDGTVYMPTGFNEAYCQFVNGGWNGLPFERAFGGQELPWALHTAVQEIWHAANMAFGLCPMLTQGAVDLLSAHASSEQKNVFLPNLVSGKWTATMSLTESQAGSDLSRIQTRAVPLENKPGVYLLTGQKIFITYGEHSMAENIIHLVLARSPSSSKETKNISLFIVPKILVSSDGTLGQRNDIWCTALEHKLGIRASPTAVLNIGDNGGAVGYLVGVEHHGLEYMFTMMNNARLSVGLEGVAIANRAYQQASNYASERIQGRSLLGGKTTQEAVTIIHHPDVRRMLMTMRALTEAARALTYYTAVQIDITHRHPDSGARKAAQSRVALLTPIVKAWSTDVGIAVTNIGIQVHGGAGFIESTGAAQHLRDARITSIYEGTNGIQAYDLVSRKILRDGGREIGTVINEVDVTIAELVKTRKTMLRPLHKSLKDASSSLKQSTAWIINTSSLLEAQAVATPYLNLLGLTLGGNMLAKSALVAVNLLGTNHSQADQFLRAKVITAHFYAVHILPRIKGLLVAITASAKSIMAMPEEDF